MATLPGTRDEIGEFANAIGEWLLTQEFGTIKPLAFRHRLGLSEEDDGLQPYVVIELLVTDPEERELSIDDPADLAPVTIPLPEGIRTWRFDDGEAVFRAARAKAGELGLPPGILSGWPVDVRLFSASRAGQHGFDPVDA